MKINKNMDLLPNELLFEIFKHLGEESKRDLFYSNLVNKNWNKLCVILLWVDPLISKYNLKMLINYLIPDILLVHNIQLNFKLIESNPFHNYPMLVKKLAIFIENFQDLVEGNSKELRRQHTDLIIKNLVARILKFGKIEEICLSGLIPYLPNDFHTNPGFHFENIKVLHYNNADSPGSSKKFVGIVSEAEELSVEIKKMMKLAMDWVNLSVDNRN